MGSSAVQLPLAGFDAPLRPTDRLFFAIFPDAATAARIGRLGQHLQAELGLRGRPLKDERFHVTLHHLGDYAGFPERLAAEAAEAAARVDAPQFDVVFDRAMSFAGRPTKRPFVLRAGDGVDGLMAFQRELGLALARVGLGAHANPGFTPHVTLLYDDRLVAEQAIEPVRWTAHEFVLVHSLLDRTVHIPLARWPLGGGAAS